MRPLLIVKTGDTLPEVAARRGDFDRWIRQGLALSRLPVETVEVHREQELPPVESVAGVVVTGSAAMVSEREAWSERTARWLKGAVEARAWILGICYGHQLLAHGFGGRVGPNPRGRQIGTVEVDLEAEHDLLLGRLPARARVQATHVEVVLAYPDGAVPLGRSALDPHHAFRLGDRAWGVQFHPEFDADIMRGYIDGRRDLIAGEGGDPGALKAACRDSPDGRTLLGRFGELVEAAESGSPAV
ncbi:MAG: glutamine amidotransferase [Myxococcota bacterium]|nr:glutamine amidotransferase [Myxococcota bacterium]